MDDKIAVHIKGVDYSVNADDSKMHVTLDIDIFEKPQFDNMKLVEKLARKVNEIKL
ncbi:hypothetical protein [Ligilactobacillus salivarius]|uniref:Uncharacterized protein n=1 Tax=Ligilactobacillus salivarius cp400 TaxID=1273133 RepID=V6DHT7_9LACO|nr:hypothetical protein [Ligilactobacillus salivarius]MDH4960372.1 hypothetical protein [Ligilactobacillus salivarius]UUY24329.1 hypothetical protein NUU06_10050 [Ligilactobacillus salivarius]CDK34235.1 FIG00754047: hypothetical protein [Ligilactobacillus salivarius cp400]